MSEATYNLWERIGRKIVFTLFQPLIWLIKVFKISPNVLTAFGLLINIGGAIIFLIGAETTNRLDFTFISWGGLVILIGGLFDMLDGYIAKKFNLSSKFGALFDSVIDRYSELFMFFGIAYYLVSHDYFFSSVMTFMALIGSMMVSYTRARAEGLGVPCSVGVMQRPLRIILIGFSALLTGILQNYIGNGFELSLFGLDLYIETISIFIIPIIIVAVFANYTAFQRLYHSYKYLNK